MGVRRIWWNFNPLSQLISSKDKRTKKHFLNSKTELNNVNRLVPNKPKFVKKRRNNEWHKKEKSERRRKKRPNRKPKKKKLARRQPLQTCHFIMVATWPEPKRTNPTRDKPIVKSRRNILLKTRKLSTSTIFKLTDSVKRPRNCGTNSTNTKKKNTTTNKESLARNTTASNYVNVSTST